MQPPPSMEARDNEELGDWMVNDRHKAGDNNGEGVGVEEEDWRAGRKGELETGSTARPSTRGGEKVAQLRVRLRRRIEPAWIRGAGMGGGARGAATTGSVAAAAAAGAAPARVCPHPDFSGGWRGSGSKGRCKGSLSSMEGGIVPPEAQPSQGWCRCWG